MNPKILKLIIQYKEDNQTSNQEEALMTLWEDFQPLVISCMRKFYVTLPQREDIRQEAFIQLLQCANTYDLSQGVPFESYFKMNLNYWFLNRIRKKTELLVVDHDWQSGLSMADLMISTLGNAPEAAEISETNAALGEALGGLTAKQHQAVTLFYFGGIPLTQISKQMGCSYKVACKHKEAGIKKIRKIFCGDSPPLPH